MSDQHHNSGEFPVWVHRMLAKQDDTHTAVIRLEEQTKTLRRDVDDKAHKDDLMHITREMQTIRQSHRKGMWLIITGAVSAMGVLGQKVINSVWP